jgi:large subunit ribosomal protein L4
VRVALFKGGGGFGPRPRSYSFKLNKNLRNVWLENLLSQSKRANIIVLEDFNLKLKH